MATQFFRIQTKNLTRVCNDTQCIGFSDSNIETAQAIQDRMYVLFGINTRGENVNDFPGVFLADMYYFANGCANLKVGQESVINLDHDGYAVQVRVTRIRKPRA